MNDILQKSLVILQTADIDVWNTYYENLKEIHDKLFKEEKITPKYYISKIFIWKY